MNKLFNRIAGFVAREPVAFGTTVVVVVIVVVSLIFGAPVEAILASVGTVVATFVQVRQTVTPWFVDDDGLSEPPPDPESEGHPHYGV